MAVAICLALLSTLALGGALLEAHRRDPLRTWRPLEKRRRSPIDLALSLAALALGTAAFYAFVRADTGLILSLVLTLVGPYAVGTVGTLLHNRQARRPAQHV